MGLLDGIFSGKGKVADNLIGLLGGDAVLLRRTSSGWQRVPCKAAFAEQTATIGDGLGGAILQTNFTATIAAASVGNVPVTKSDRIEKDGKSYEILESATTYSGDIPAMYTLHLNRG